MSTNTFCRIVAANINCKYLQTCQFLISVGGVLWSCILIGYYGESQGMEGVQAEGTGKQLFGKAVLLEKE
jgi:hypothetical protein